MNSTNANLILVGCAALGAMADVPPGLFANPGTGKRSRGVWGRVEPRNKTGRNEPCTCGSGKKFKRCCGTRSAR